MTDRTIEEAAFEIIKEWIPTTFGDGLVKELADAPQQEQGWRTIDDGAPKDGTQILAYEKVGGGRYIAWWGGDPGRWRFFTINSVNGYLAWPEGYGPSHWQPLPAPPSRREREGET